MSWAWRIAACYAQAQVATIAAALAVAALYAVSLRWLAAAPPPRRYRVTWCALAAVPLMWVVLFGSFWLFPVGRSRTAAGGPPTREAEVVADADEPAAADGQPTAASQPSSAAAVPAGSNWPVYLVLAASFMAIGVVGTAHFAEWRLWRYILQRETAAPEPSLREATKHWRIRLGLSQPVEVWQSNCDGFGPCVTVGRRPTLLFNTWALRHLNDAERDAVLVHELTHLRRRDPLWTSVQMGLNVLWAGNPALHWISRRLRQELECACDDEANTAFGQEGTYWEAITKLHVRQAATPRGPLWQAVAAVAGSRLSRRISSQADPLPRAALWLWLALAALAVWTALPWVFSGGLALRRDAEAKRAEAASGHEAQRWASRRRPSRPMTRPSGPLRPRDNASPCRRKAESPSRASSCSIKTAGSIRLSGS